MVMVVEVVLDALFVFVTLFNFCSGTWTLPVPRGSRSCTTIRQMRSFHDCYTMATISSEPMKRFEIAWQGCCRNGQRVDRCMAIYSEYTRSASARQKTLTELQQSHTRHVVARAIV